MLSIIIPNLDGLPHLRICLPSLKKQTFKDFCLILVDNASTDDSVKFTLESFPDAKIIQLSKNEGFAKAINKGIQLVLNEPGSDYILLLNNDIELNEEFLRTGIETFEKINNASMIATKMLSYSNRDIIDDCGDFIKANGGSPVARGHGERDTGQYDKEEFIFGACAGAAFYKKEIFASVGLFDESFFAYYEDIDFSFRAQLQGFKCYYQPKAIAYHKRGGTSSKASVGFQAEMCERNLVLMRIKNYPLSIYILYQPLFLIARLKRYYTFIRDDSFIIFLKGLKGHIRGMFLILTKLRERFRIQRGRTVSTSYIRSIFVK